MLTLQQTCQDSQDPVAGDPMPVSLSRDARFAGNSTHGILDQMHQADHATNDSERLFVAIERSIGVIKVELGAR